MPIDEPRLCVLLLSSYLRIILLSALFVPVITCVSRRDVAARSELKVVRSIQIKPLPPITLGQINQALSNAHLAIVAGQRLEEDQLRLARSVIDALYKDAGASNYKATLSVIPVSSRSVEVTISVAAQ